MHRHMLTLASAAVVATAPLGAVHAEPAGQAAEMRVKLSGLDLGSKAGADRALRRIVTASRTFCEDDNRTKSLKQYSESRRCTQAMAYKAVRQLDRPMVTAMYDRSGSLRPRIVLAAR